MIISLTHPLTRGARPARAECDYYPGRLASAGQAAAPCFVLHRMGFVVPRQLARRAVGSYPAFSP